MKAIVDCNSFYCSCERVFRPDLENKPVVVLSNNDGCIISITDEAKKLGITMAAPYFKSKEIIERHGIAVFSSNYNLYGDMSRRVMQTLFELAGKHNVEVYSVDEAFIDLSGINRQQLTQFGKQIRETVEQWTGIKVSVGIAPTKVLAKVANRLAKKNKQQTGCVLVLDEETTLQNALLKTSVNDIWGIGRQYATKLKEEWNISNAWELSRMKEEWANKYLGGVVGLRLVRELKGIPSITMDEQLTTKKMIATTRMFGTAVTQLNDIKEAVATYTSRAAEKLRRQQSAANMITVFVVPKETSNEDRFRHGPTVSSYTILPKATSFTNELIKPALELAERLYKKGNYYKKAGIILSGLVPDDSIQGNLFATEHRNEGRVLMNMIDNINFSMRDDILKFASAGTTKDWKMRQELRSPRYTCRWDELCKVK